MLDIFGVHGLLLAVVALIVIGPKDMPKAMRVLGYWVGRARGVARQFRSGFDNMVREAELAEMEKKWAAENERIMKEHGVGTAAEAPTPAHDATPAGDAATASLGDAATARTDEPDLFTQPVMVEKPHVESAPAASSAADAKASS